MVVVVDDVAGGVVVGTGGTVVSSVGTSVDGSVEDVTSLSLPDGCEAEVPTSVPWGEVGSVVVESWPDDDGPVAPERGDVVPGATGASCPTDAAVLLGTHGILEVVGRGREIGDVCGQPLLLSLCRHH